MNPKIFYLLFICGFLLTSNLLGCSPYEEYTETKTETISIKVPQNTLEVTQNALEERSSYDEIDLKTELPANTILSGKDPESIVVKAFVNSSKDTQSETNIQQTITVNKDNPNLAIVMITQMNFPDDSLRGIRYRVDFEPQQSQWRMVWAGRQYTCQPGRGLQNWSSNLCL